MLGFGVTKLGGVSLYGEAAPGLCEACQVQGCLDCLNYYKRCEGCKTGYGPSTEYTRPGSRRLLQDTSSTDGTNDYDYDYDYGNSADYVESNSFESCTKCSEDRCGICGEIYSKCDGYYSDCDTSVTRVGKASEVSVDAIDKCEGDPGFAGNGYTSKRVYTIIDGDCAECGAGVIGWDWYWYPLDSATGEVATYCWMDGRMRSVAANAFQASDGCPYPGTVMLKLQNLCYTNNRGVSFNVYATFEGTYCGVTKTVYVFGDSIFGPIWEKLGEEDAITWTYASTKGKEVSSNSPSPSPSPSLFPSSSPSPSKEAIKAEPGTTETLSPGIVTGATSPSRVAKISTIALIVFFVVL